MEIKILHPASRKLPLMLQAYSTTEFSPRSPQMLIAYICREVIMTTLFHSITDSSNLPCSPHPPFIRDASHPKLSNRCSLQGKNNLQGFVNPAQGTHPFETPGFACIHSLPAAHTVKLGENSWDPLTCEWELSHDKNWFHNPVSKERILRIQEPVEILK